MKVLRIAHISDLHVARRPAWDEWTLKRLMGYGNYALNRRFRHQDEVIAKAVARVKLNPPHLVIATGDLIQTGLGSELSAVEDLLSPLTKKGVPIIVTEGNHDRYGGPSPIAWRKFRERLEAGLGPDENGIYHLPGLEVLPLDQGMESPPFFSYGNVERHRLEAISEVWSGYPKGVVRLVCGHYPVVDERGRKLKFFYGLKGWRELVHFLRSLEVSAYLCGHYHKRYMYDLGSGVIQYVAPSLSNDGRMDMFECIDGEFEFIGEG